MTVHFIYPEGAEEYGIQRSLTKEQRDAIPDHLFAWPDAPDGPEYPIDTQAHLDATATLIGKAPEDEQPKIKARAIKLAKEQHLDLPDSWQEDDKSDDGTQERAAQGVTAESLSIYLPITRSDAANHIVSGQATAEVPDSYGTIFGYCPEAWQQWRGNIREQHDSKKAVGKALEVIPDPLERAIYVDAKVSRGAPDTWLKVEDGVLSGFSAAIMPDPEFGNNPARWPRKEYNGKQYPYLPKYRVLELSLVDHPATPGCNIQIVRADGFVTDVVEVDEQEQPAQAEQTPIEAVVAPTPETQERSGARISSDTQNGLHSARNGAIQQAIALMKLCQCDGCQAACTALDPDGDGDIDFMGLDDPDGDAENLGATMPQTDDTDTDEAMLDRMQRVMAPVYTRQQSFLARLSHINFETHNAQILERLAKLDTLDSFESLLKSTIDAALERVASHSALDEVRASLEAVRGQVEQIAAQPTPGGPILNGAGRPYDKSNPYSPAQQAPQENQYQVLERLHQQGAFRTMDDQIAAASLLMKPQQVRG